MKIFHLADLHLASPLEQLENRAEERRNEIFDSFTNVLHLAKSRGVNVVLLSGDIFDGNRPRLRDKMRFYSTIEDFPEITFLYLRGNHDTNQSYDRQLPNLLTFSDDKWSSYTFGDVVVSGIEISNGDSAAKIEALTLDPSKYNIIMLHGTLVGGSQALKTGQIPLKSLEGKNIDYLALGHLHTFSSGKIDARGSWAYSGCLEGRGYDECGKKGFVEIDTDRSVFEFVPSSTREVNSIKVDVSPAQTAAEAVSIVADKIADIDRKTMLKVELVGETTFDPSSLEERLLRQNRDFYHFKVKNSTRKYISIEEYEKRNSLLGEFVRLVRDDKNITDQQRQLIYKLGINTLTQ